MNQMLPYSEPKKDHNLERFCESLCAGQSPEMIPVQEPSYAKKGHCYENVEKRIKQKGGGIIYGWEISCAEGIWLEAQFHAVWGSPKGGLIDVTPEEFGRNRVLFLRDPQRVYNGIPVAFRRFHIDGYDKNKVQDIWELQDQILIGNDVLRNQGIDPQSQLCESLMRSKLLVYKNLIDELKKNKQSVELTQ